MATFLYLFLLPFLLLKILLWCAWMYLTCVLLYADDLYSYHLRNNLACLLIVPLWITAVPLLLMIVGGTIAGLLYLVVQHRRQRTYHDGHKLALLQSCNTVRAHHHGACENIHAAVEHHLSGGDTAHNADS